MFLHLTYNLKKTQIKSNYNENIVKKIAEKMMD